MDMKQITRWQDVQIELFNRYGKLMADGGAEWRAKVGLGMSERAQALCEHGLAHVESIAEDKSNRWLGFIQGVLACAGLIDIEVERDYTRPLFHALHGEAASIDVRKTKPTSSLAPET
jgi:hypothetical protein